MILAFARFRISKYWGKLDDELNICNYYLCGIMPAIPSPPPLHLT